MDSPETSRGVELVRFSPAKGKSIREDSEVVAEQLLSIRIEGGGRYVISCTPCDVEELAAGFACSEGLISGKEDIVHLGPCAEDPNAVEMKLKHPPDRAPGRNLLMTSSCGLCGTRNIEKYLTGEEACGETLKIAPATLLEVGKRMRAGQEIFSRTGGTHAAALFQGDGRIVALAEDIGRHNAMDKVVGKRLLAGQSPAGCGVMLSGRVSFEIVAKAARAGIELIAAVSAPSLLAVNVAERCRITLCGFVREDRLSAYTHPGRISP